MSCVLCCACCTVDYHFSPAANRLFHRLTQHNFYISRSCPPPGLFGSVLTFSLITYLSLNGTTWLFPFLFFLSNGFYFPHQALRVFMACQAPTICLPTPFSVVRSLSLCLGPALPTCSFPPSIVFFFCPSPPPGCLPANPHLHCHKWKTISDSWAIFPSLNLIQVVFEPIRIYVFTNGNELMAAQQFLFSRRQLEQGWEHVLDSVSTKILLNSGKWQKRIKKVKTICIPCWFFFLPSSWRYYIQRRGEHQ